MPDRMGPTEPGPMGGPEQGAARVGAARRRTRRRLGLVAVALLAAAGLALGAGANASVPRGDPAARLPEGALAGEAWDLVARFESGHLLLATVALTNTPLGGRTGSAPGTNRKTTLAASSH